MLPTPGHTPWHQSVLVESDGEVACFLADVCPTTAHLPLPWIMGYDLEPLVTLESKRGLWERACEEEWLLVFEHDAVVPWGRLDPASERPASLELSPVPGDRDPRFSLSWRGWNPSRAQRSSTRLR